MEEFKKKYNALLKRNNNAERYLGVATDKQLEKWLPAFIQITFNLSKMMNYYNYKTGKDMTTEEILQGFNI